MITVSLQILGVFFIAMGLAYLAAPRVMAQHTGITDATNAGLTDIRATYGGFQTGFGIFMLWAAQNPATHGWLLLCLFCIFIAVALCRFVGIVLGGSSLFNVGGFVFELALAGLAIKFYFSN